MEHLVIILPPNNNKFTWFGLFYNFYIKDEEEYNTCIIYMDINITQKLLYIGDQSYFIHCYDLSVIYKIISSSNNIKIQ